VFDMTDDIPTRLRALNNAQRGSFGEYLFAAVAKQVPGSRLETVRSNQTDFVFGGERIDVKTTIRNVARPFRPLVAYRGHRVSGVKYAQVEFAIEGVRVSIENTTIEIIPWSGVATLWGLWVMQAQPREHVQPDVRRLAVIRGLIRDHFAKYGISARILYRTGQQRFGKESPANLIAKRAKPDRITVFIDFRDPNIHEGNIRRIIAFADSEAVNLPMFLQTRLHRTKVDLDAISSEAIRILEEHPLFILGAERGDHIRIKVTGRSHFYGSPAAN
jgi:hypothetical protein